MSTAFHPVALAGTVLGVTLFSATTVQAQEITRAFEVTVDEGGLAGEVFPGTVTYDASFLGESAVLFPGEFSLTFDFLGTTFTEADDFFGFATAEISEFGPVIGLGYLVDSLDSPNAFFGFAPSDDSIGDEFFYTVFDATGAAVDEGAGTFESVPEPATAIALGALGLGALVSRKRRQSA